MLNVRYKNLVFRCPFKITVRKVKHVYVIYSSLLPIRRDAPVTVDGVPANMESSVVGKKEVRFHENSDPLPNFTADTFEDLIAG